LAILQAACGDLAAPRQFAVQSETRTEKNTILLYHHLPLLRSTLALRENKPADAVALLEAARTYQLNGFDLPYLRAQAKTKAGMLDASATDYRLILDNQGVDPVSPLYPLAHLGLARVLALQNNKPASRREYEKFFEMWKDADADIPVLQQARIEYSRLK
jgi:hypothetical protein